MEIKYYDEALMDLKFCRKSGNKDIQYKIYQLIINIIKHLFERIGKPEALKYELSGKWLRHINIVQRINYEIRDNIFSIHSLKGHHN